MIERLFSKKHIWIVMKGENAILGVTDYAQKKLGSIMFLNLPELGEKIVAGQRFGDIESIKIVSDLISPLNGEVIRINEKLLDEPDMINDTPYDSWFMEIRVNSLSEDLMDEETYLLKKEEL